MSTALLPLALRVGRGRAPNPYARLLSFFLGFGAAFVWLAIAVEGLFYVAYSLTLCLWVEVEAALRPQVAPGKKVEKVEKETAQGKKAAADALTYRPRADDLRIAVFFLFFVQVAFFGTGKCVFYLTMKRND